MKFGVRLAVAWVAVALMAGPALSREPLSAERAVEAMGFLAGSWSGPMWGGEFVAYYSTPEGGKILGYSELLRDGTVSFFEFEKFDVRDGELVFSPFPGGKPLTQLKLAEIDADAARAVFENPDKDFPTRIVYHRVSPDRLVITLSDPHGGSGKVETFDLRRK